jgi:FkbM family methyltransferase
MKVRLKRAFHKLLAHTWLRPGTKRSVLLGPYRGLHFYLSPPMRSRLSVFYRAYERDVSAWLAAQIRPGMTIFILGGHVGIHALYAAKLLVGAGCVYVFEGWPENCEALKTNIRINPRLEPQIQAIASCISDHSGSIAMSAGSSDGKHHVSADSGAEAISVPAVTLDDFTAEHALRPDLIVMDIEGHELAALHGGQRIIESCRPLLLLEHHDNQALLARWLSARGYRLSDLGRRHTVAQP